MTISNAGLKVKYCSLCGAKVTTQIPQGDNRKRVVCTSCGHIHYTNPLIVVSTLPVCEDRILLCKRAIEPCYGLWTLPGGFMENGESLEQAAVRETREEACVEVTLGSICGLYSLTVVDQVYVFYWADLDQKASFGPGEESLDVRLFRMDEIPWDQLAFKVMSLMLGQMRDGGLSSRLTTGIIGS